MTPNLNLQQPGGSTIDWMFRCLTWRHRRLPDLIIIGAQKAGTTSLFHYLLQHPQLVPSSIKEVHYFDGGLNPAVDTFQKGERWYRAHFPLAARCQNGSKVFEASPFYLFHPLVPERMAAVVPKAKLIVLLRNPTDRAISHYFHARRVGYEDLPIDQALRAEESRVRGLVERQQWKDPTLRHYTYKARGRYAEQLERFMGKFPRNQLLVLNSERLACEPERVLRSVFEFAEIDSAFQIKNLQRKNVGSGKKEVSQELTSYLGEYFAPHNNRLFDLLGEDYGWNSIAS
ncbi:MAG TPA: sulfotransferase domain-containing protein [Terriglobales bacterium]|nr:sulfotransferase domain-containing protein [Terriglobales bacterium]